MTNPKITVVTVCYNAVRAIEKTILSVVNQTYENIEYIIIDGASTDGTVDVIKKYEDRITKWISEPDKGIYDAMNKGIKMATGEWLYFLNAGDFLLNKKSLYNFFAKSVDINHNVDVKYGSIRCRYSYGSYVLNPKPLKAFHNCMPMCHPATIIRTDLAKKENFDTSYKIAADYKMLYTLYQTGCKFEYVDVVLAEFEAEKGVSSSISFDIIKENSMINGTYKSFHYYIQYFSYITKNMIRFLILSANPKLLDKIRKRNLLKKYKIHE